MDLTLLLVDDDADLCGLIHEFFSEQGIALDLCHDGEKGLSSALSGRYPLIILDVMLPRMDGFQVLKRIREKSAVPVLMLTARTEQQSRILGLNQGADDYLPKPFDPHELIARVRAILRRVQPVAAQQAAPVDVMGIRLDPRSRAVARNGDPVELTSVEFDILELLMRSAGRVVTRDDLANRLYQRDSTPFDRAIDVHLSHLRKKLEIPKNVLRTVRGVGYQFCIEPVEEDDE
jgi:two-component system, OmpR family, response regulator CpxR